MKNARTLSFAVFYSVCLIHPAYADTPGSAVVTVGDQEHLIPIECRDAKNALMGLSTEPNRLTKARTNRRSGVRLNLRPWKDTNHIIVSLDRYVAWLPTPANAGPELNLSLDMSSATLLVEGTPQALTYDRWMAGDRGEAISGVSIEVDCAKRDDLAPRYRKVAKGKPR